MRLSCWGARRTLREHVLIEGERGKILVERFKGGGGWRDEKTGALWTTWHTSAEVRLNGNYRIALRLSRDDVANLFIAAFGDNLADGIKALDKANGAPVLPLLKGN
jgi:hypothetical protein